MPTDDETCCEPWWKNRKDIFGLSDPVYDLIFLPWVVGFGVGYLASRVACTAKSSPGR